MSTQLKRSLTDLPSNVLVEILARLPLRTLFVAKSVCKTFVFLSTSDPHFISMYSSNAAQIPVFQVGGLTAPSSLLHLADQELDYKNSELKPLFQLPNLLGKNDSNNLFLANSCNGLLYFMQNGLTGDGRSLVCNPVTSEYIIIPDAGDHKMSLDTKTKGLCLGFSPSTDQYKVLRMFCWMKGRIEFGVGVQVYVIGSDSWRHIDGTLLCGHQHFFHQHLLWGISQTLVNGHVYWYYGGLWSGVIVSFDFERENFGEVALPAECQDKCFTARNYTGIGVLGGCLCLSCNDYPACRVYLWVMNGDSWRKEFVVNTLGFRNIRNIPVQCKFEPLEYLGNGEILMILQGDSLVCYDPRTETFRYKVKFCLKAVALTPSIVPLKDTLKVEKVSLLKPRYLNNS